MSHLHFTRDERVRLQTLKRARLSNRAIARQLGFHPASIGRELQRGFDPSVATGYNVRKAQAYATAARAAANQQHRKLHALSPLSLYIAIRLGQYWSPEQIALRLVRRCKKVAVSYHTIYRWLWAHGKRSLAIAQKYLRHPKLRRKYGTKRREQARELAKKRWIEQRPKGAANRSRYGHWEGDTVLGAKNSGRIVTLVERKSGYLLAARIPDGSMASFQEAAVALLGTLPVCLRLSLTLDNGKEMNAFETIERRTGTPIYFAHPYHSWERGTNENTNGLLRQFFPKGMDFGLLTQAELDEAVKLLNTRPRKRLQGETPAERMRRVGLRFEG